jgi:hypothetical protein
MEATPRDVLPASFAVALCNCRAGRCGFDALTRLHFDEF